MPQQEVTLDDIVYVLPGGLRFTLKPSSINARKAASERLSRVKEETDKHIADLRHNRRVQLLKEEKAIIESDGGTWEGEEIPEELDVSDFEPYNILFELFCALTTGPHDEIDRGDFDTRWGKRARADFLGETPLTEELQMISLGL